MSFNPMTETNIVEIKNEVKGIIANKEVIASLAMYTFKDIAPNNIPKALTEGMLRGYKLEDFLTKKVYAVKFGAGYALVQSIEDARVKANRSGLTGKSKPTYTYKEDGKAINSCEVTVFKKDGHEAGYTAEVFFDEYSTGQNMWGKKPHTMIAKVAEMHALRMAFPEEITLYSEEEVQKTYVETTVVSDEDAAKVEAMQKYAQEIEALDSKEALEAYWTSHKDLKLGKEFTAMITSKKEELENGTA